MHTKLYPQWVNLIIVAAIISIIQLSCRFIPGSKTNPDPPANELPPADSIISVTQIPPSDTSTDPNTNPSVQNNWKLQHQIGGNTYAVAFLPGTQYSLVGVGSRVVLLDTEPLRELKGNSAQRIQSLWQSDILPGVVRSISVSDHYAYVAAGKGHILIFDIVDPLAIQQISDLDEYAWAMSLVTSGNRLFVADNNQGLWIADISDPIHPVPFNSDSLKISAVGLAYQEPNLFLVDISGKLTIYDLTDPSEVQLIGQLDLPQLSTDLVIDGEFAYLSAGSGGLWVVDISDPTAPVKVADRASAMADGITKSGNMVYVTDYAQGLLTYDVRRPHDPQLVNSKDILLFNQGVPGKRGIAVAGETLMIANQNEGAVFFSLKMPDAPKLIAKFVAELSGTAFDLNMQDSIVYVTRDFLGLGLISLEPPEPFYLVTEQPTFFDGDPLRTVWKQAVEGDFIYQADVNRGLTVVNLSNSQQLNEVNQVALPRSWSNVLIIDDLLIGTTVNTSPNREGSDDIRSLRVLDISEPADPQLISFLKMDYNAQEVVISDHYIFYPDSLVQQEQAQAGKPKLRVIDFSNPDKLDQVAEVDISQSCPVVMAAQIAGNVLYLGDNSRGICIFDISNPLSPVFVHRIEGVAPVRDLRIGNGSLFAAAWSSVAVFNLGDPLKPQLTDTIVTPGLASGVEIHSDGSLLVADMDNGVVWYTEQK